MKIIGFFKVDGKTTHEEFICEGFSIANGEWICEILNNTAERGWTYLIMNANYRIGDSMFVENQTTIFDF